MKYPNELFDVVRNQTFYITYGLCKATGEDKNEPLKIQHKSYARSPCTGITHERKPATANLSPFDVPDVVERSNFAYHKDMELSMAPTTSDHSPAYTTRIVSGTLKGKTPAEVLLEMPNGQEMLHNQINFLSQNFAFL